MDFWEPSETTKFVSWLFVVSVIDPREVTLILYVLFIYTHILLIDILNTLLNWPQMNATGCLWW